MKTMNNRLPAVRVSIPAALAFGAVLSFCGSALYAGETAKEVKQALNIFINADVTKGVPMTIDAKGATTIGSEVEYPGFAFGTYDVDASASSLKMTLATDPSKLQVGTYDSETSDLYYYEFDRKVSKAELAEVTEGFAAAVTIMTPGETVESKGAFADNLGTSYTFENGGILIAIGEGSALRTVGTGGSLTVELDFE